LVSEQYRGIETRYLFSTIIGNVNTFLKCILFGTVDTILFILLDISVTLLK